MSPIAVPSQFAAVLYAPHDIRIEERTLWPPQYNQVQVKVVSTGLCGSDLHYYSHGKVGDFAVREPLVLGHEASGIVTAVGPGVTNLVPGQKVAIEAGIMCNQCEYCTNGRYNLCRNMRFCSSAKTFPHTDGTLQNRINHPSYVLHPLPDGCSFEHGALAEPLSVLIHASRRAQLTAGQTVLVFGVGTIGLLACALAKSLGATRVVAIDINRARLDFAMNNGFATDIFHMPKTDKAKTSEEQLRRTEKHIRDALLDLDQSDGFDVVFECSGAESCVQMACYAAVTGGKVMLIGMGSSKLMFPLAAATIREVDVLGCFRYANTYPAALKLLASGELENVEKLITHRFSLEEVGHAFELLKRGVDDDGNIVIKVMITAST